MNNGYEFVDIDGRPCAINTKTGEVTDAVTITVAAGSKVLTPAEQEARKKYMQRESKRFSRRKCSDEKGNFYFVSRNNQLNTLSAETAARLIYLSTFLNFDNRFMFSQRQPIYKRDLQDVLGLSVGTTHKFWHEVSPLYIIEDADGLKLTNDDIIRGDIRKRRESFQRFYIQAVRKLYRATKAPRHKHLGRVFKLLPFVNIEYNIVSWNPDEGNLDNIRQMTIEEFCEITGYDVHDYKKLLAIYKQITIEINGHQEYFLSYVVNDGDNANARIFVNPNAVYCGSDDKKVEVLGSFCKKKVDFLESQKSGEESL